MEQNLTEFKVTMTAIVGILTGFWGWQGWLTIGWLVCMALDYLTGTAAAGKAGEWNSARAREGIWHKAGMIVVAAVACGADLLTCVLLENLPVLQLPIQYTGLIYPVVLVWYILTELGSMLENAVALGAPVPTWLTRFLKVSSKLVESVGEQMDGGGEDDGG